MPKSKELKFIKRLLNLAQTQIEHLEEDQNPLILNNSEKPKKEKKARKGTHLKIIKRSGNDDDDGSNQASG